MTPYNIPFKMARAEWTIQDPGDGEKLTFIQNGVVELKSEDAETRILMPPNYVNQLLTLVLHTDGGNVTVSSVALDGETAQKLNMVGNTQAEASEAGDTLALVGVKVGTLLYWKVLMCDGFTLSTP